MPFFGPSLWFWKHHWTWDFVRMKNYMWMETQSVWEYSVGGVSFWKWFPWKGEALLDQPNKNVFRLLLWFAWHFLKTLEQNQLDFWNENENCHWNVSIRFLNNIFIGKFNLEIPKISKKMLFGWVSQVEILYYNHDL